jgi:quercetin dioxygenase-like cupin family protein
MKNNAIIRKPLLNVTLNSKIVTSVDVREIAFAASQKTGLHKHPRPVMSVVERTAVREVLGQPAQQLPAGSSFYEPADTVIRAVR